MYECPNCASNLKFNIARQMLFCENCETTVDPYSFYKGEDAEETLVSVDEYEVTVFTCPQCGGEILSDDTTAATFCSFCGASTILDSRISKESCPGHIIPFAKTKEECAENYSKMMRRAFFAPDELKDKKNIEKFRGIYMPYWVYGFAKKGPVSFTGTHSYRRGDYRYTDYYNLNCVLDEQYKGLAFDAAASFSDNLSSAVSLFDFSKVKKFVPGFLSGFYADISDVGKYVYEKDAQEIVTEDGYKRIAKGYTALRYKLNDEKNASSVREAVRPSKSKAEFALLPVWFLSYRKGDRVCYAVVNGQTGKVVADLPVDPKKYLLGSVLLAIPLFILLNLFFTVTPTKILFIAALLALVCFFISNGQLSDIFEKESGTDDKGLMWSRDVRKATIRPESGQERDLAETMAREREKAEQRRMMQSRPGMRISAGVKELLVSTGGVLLSTIVLVALIMLFIVIDSSGAIMAAIGIYFTGMFLLAYRVPVKRLFGRTKKKARRPLFSDFKRKLPILAKPMAGILCAIVIFILNPVADEFYYIGAFVCMGSVLWAIIDIIKQHNILTTRTLPQFNKRGGDENA